MSNSRPAVSLTGLSPAQCVPATANPDQSKDPIVVVGSGPVGMRCIEEIKQFQPNAAIVLYGEESGNPYNRVQLSALLAGETTEPVIRKPINSSVKAGLVAHFGCRVVSIDRDNKRIKDEYDRHQHYSKLILATGSRPRKLPIPGTHLDGVSTFRNLPDVDYLLSRVNCGDRFVIIGGGLLGLEIAWGLSRHNAKVTVVEFADRLLSRQLDQPGAQRLRNQIEQTGIEILTQVSVDKILGKSRVRALRLSNGNDLPCESVIVATGIEANIDIATEAGIDTDKGVIVNNSMQTSDGSIYAVGECAEHQGRVYGLVAPGIEQARVLARTLQHGNNNPETSNPDSQYHGSNESSYLKVAGNAVFSATQSAILNQSPAVKSYTFASNHKEIYRRIYLRERKLVGAIGLGQWQETTKVRHAIDDGCPVSALQLLRFRLTGSIWGDTASYLEDLACDEIICQCMSVDKATIQSLVDRGAVNVSAIAEATGASTVCGSCKPLILSLQGHSGKVAVTQQQTVFRALMATASLFLLLLVLAPPVPLAQSAENWPWWDALWRDSFNRQLSGFALLAITVAAAAIGARKRLALLRHLGDFSGWRTVHLLLGSGFVLCLIAHTGFRFGHGLDRLLLLNFFIALVAGLVTSIGYDRHASAPTGASSRSRHNLNLVHIATIWPIPVVLGWHIFKSYWY